MSTLNSYITGLDLGQRSDPSAIAVLNRRMIKVDTALEPVTTESKVTVRPFDTGLDIAHGHSKAAKAPPVDRLVSRYDCSLLQRFDIQTPYPNIVERVCGLTQRSELEYSTLVVDWTGVGTGIVDYFVKARREPVTCPKCKGDLTAEPCLTCRGEGKIKLKANVRPVLITSGTKWSIDGNGWRVSKQELVSVVQILVQQVLPDGLPRLIIDPSLPFAREAVSEFKSFKFKITESANITYEHWREGSHADIVMSIAIACWVGEHLKKPWMHV